ncbi:uncharacterized protein K02A2.6-like [Hydractinia symbiolongicarpus]|uniref:uncharacterized protein K02A2.6-like n=1 Tax=Hydractinia symbiolongicarpus TaxID=13093 RepID=UPI00254E3CEE|nr:uncharacterized protein K02A2.6-like [Hydractinia symbiolongicarpus]
MLKLSAIHQDHSQRQNKNICKWSANVLVSNMHRKFKQKLTVTADRKIILKGSRIVLPASLHKVSVMLAHSGHQSLTNTKAPTINKLRSMPSHNIKEEIRVRKTNTHTPPPLAYLFMDWKSKFPEIGFLKSTNSAAVIKPFERTFSLFGYPNKLVSDNGLPFKSFEIRKYMEEKGITHRKITPFLPQANSQVERFMGPLANSLRKASIENRDFQIACYNFLLSYCTTPHSTTNVTPADLMFNCKIKTTLPDWTNHVDVNTED